MLGESCAVELRGPLTARMEGYQGVNLRVVRFDMPDLVLQVPGAKVWRGVGMAWTWEGTCYEVLKVLSVDVPTRTLTVRRVTRFSPRGNYSEANLTHLLEVAGKRFAAGQAGASS